MLPRQEGREYAVDHLTPSGTTGPGWFVVVTNEEAEDFRIIAAPDEDLGTTRAWREIVPHRPGVRVDDLVDPRWSNPHRSSVSWNTIIDG